MGKLKKGRKNQKARVNPMASKTPQLTKKDESTRHSKIVPLINKLRSSIPNDKSMALSAITVLVEDERMRHLLLKEKLVAVVMETCLNDSHDEIALDAFGLLRNIAIEEGADVAKHLWRLGVWTSVEAALNKINESFKFLSNEKEHKSAVAKVQLLFDFCENIMSLVVVLASADDSIYDAVFARIDPILDLVLRLVNGHTHGQLVLSTKLFNTLLELLYEFCVESTEFIEKLGQYQEEWDQLNSLVEDAGYKNNSAKIYLEGIKFCKYDALSSHDERKQEKLGQTMKNIFAISTSVDLEQVLTRIDQIENPDNAQHVIKKDAESIEQDLNSSNKAKSEVESDLSVIETGLTILTTVLESLSENETEPGEPVQLPCSVEEIILREIYPMLTELLKVELDNPSLQLEDQILAALNNLSWLLLSTANIPVAWYEQSLALWDLTLRAMQRHLRKSSLGILWAILKSHGPEMAEKKMPHDLIEQLLQVPLAEEYYDLFPGVIGVLGTVAVVIANTEITYLISQKLISSITAACDIRNETIAVEVIVESFNLFFDIFGDMNFPYDHEIFVEKDYLSWLKSIEPRIKEVYKKTDKNKQPTNKLRMEETWNNLERFIEYKQHERGG
ncbi:uncharacterized protein LODBEIA_P17930 [Lodderomyces beijingensis]|uniref:SYO1-like TPR repeats domain-containing protein n=1 Tax=Lodderomyces beijingensis TaxID=1775926 RepID=A0ABP0ZHD3_9ASCO